MKDIKFLKSNLIAHRGVHNSKMIENTLPAFIRAIDKNYIIELDIHILRDNKIVIMHDYNLKRLTGVNKIVETLSYAQLSKIKIKGKYQILELTKLMHIINGKVPLLIEVKDVNNNQRFEENLVKILDNYKGKFAIHTSNPFVIDWFHKNRKEYVIGLIIYNKINYNMLKKCIKKVDFISLNKKEIPIKCSKKILGWTIKNEKEYNKYKEKCFNLICENIL